MHDCPRCQVPLHGHEQFCPSCGTKQYVRPEFKSFGQQTERPFNPIPFALGAALIGIVVFIAAQNSWIGQVMNRAPVVEDPNSKLTPPQARQMLVDGVNSNLSAVGAKAKLTWTSGEQPADVNSPGIVELSIDTELHDPKQRKQVMDPVKQLMDRGKISTITMNDSKSHATWTYSMTAVDDSKYNSDISGY